MKPAALLAITVVCQAASPTDCAPCHRKETRNFGKTSMARALFPAAASDVLKANPKLTASISGYDYALTTSGPQPLLSVSKDGQTVTTPLAWAFGEGVTGQTYLYEQDGRWYESRVSYYKATKGLDVTMGMRNIIATNLNEAPGRLTQVAEAGQCFDCHATNVIKSPRLDLSTMREGIQCERCHGAAESHVAAKAPLRKLTRLTTEEQSDFCGQCHRTWAQVAAGGPRGIENVRFQPYRLANSKCYDAADSRIRCTACHDPHNPLETAAAPYDAACLACHSRAARPATKASAHICKRGTSNCASCHMPRLDLPGAHNQFTDHWIRVAKTGAAYPD